MSNPASFATAAPSDSPTFTGTTTLGTCALGGTMTCGSNDITGIGIATAQVVRGAVSNLLLRPAVAGGVVGIQKADGATYAFQSDATGTAVNGATPVARASAITAPTAPSAAYVQAEAQSMETAVNAIRVALANFGITL